MSLERGCATEAAAELSAAGVTVVASRTVDDVPSDGLTGEAPVDAVTGSVAFFALSSKIFSAACNNPGDVDRVLKTIVHCLFRRFDCWMPCLSN